MSKKAGVYAPVFCGFDSELLRCCLSFAPFYIVTCYLCFVEAIMHLVGMQLIDRKTVRNATYAML